MINVAQYGKTIGLNFRTWLGPIPLIVISNPDDLKILYNHPLALNKSRLTKVCLRPVAGDSVLLSDCKFAGTVPSKAEVLRCFCIILAGKWKNRRRMVVRTLTKSILDSFHSNFIVLSNGLVQNWDIHADKDTFDIRHSLAQVSMDIAGSRYPV